MSQSLHPQNNAFCDHFLRQTAQRDEPPTAAEAEFAGPWTRHQGDHQTDLFRAWESPHQGDIPFAQLTDPQTAQLATALLPARGQLGTYRLHPEGNDQGFLLSKNGKPVGHLSYFDEHLVEGLSLLEALIRNPKALADLLEAAGPTALEQTGKILLRNQQANTQQDD